MQGVLLLLDPEAVGEDVVPLGLLPEVVELDELADRPEDEVRWRWSRAGTGTWCPLSGSVCCGSPCRRP